MPGEQSIGRKGSDSGGGGVVMVGAVEVDGRFLVLVATVMEREVVVGRSCCVMIINTHPWYDVMYCGNINLFQCFVFPFYQYGGYVCKFLFFLYVRVL